MVRITETEITDVNGQVKKIRHIESACARIEWPDGKVEEYSDANANEWPWPRDDKSPEWHVSGIHIPISSLVGLAGKFVFPNNLTLLSETGEIILKLVGIVIGAQMSIGSEITLVGNEIPIDSDLPGTPG